MNSSFCNSVLNNGIIFDCPTFSRQLNVKLGKSLELACNSDKKVSRRQA